MRLWVPAWSARPYAAFWGASAVLHLVFAVTSFGWHQADELVQTLQFGWFRAEGFDPVHMPWEYELRMRPWLQPALYFLVFRGAGVVSVTDPFVLAALCRLVTGALVFFSTVAFARAIWPWIADRPATAKAVVFVLTLAWFVPYMDVRPSSVALARALFLLGISAVVVSDAERPAWRDGWPALATGALFGLAFEARYQAAIMVVGVLAWLLLGRRVRQTLLVCAGGLVVLGLAALVDRWGYGTWAFPPWPYLAQNLIEGKVTDFGTGRTPWWWFLEMVGTVSPPPFGPLIVVGAVVAWARRPLHLLSLTSWPLVLVHTAIGHKELRYVVVVAPLVLVLILVELGVAERVSAWTAGWARGARRALLGAALAVNFAWMLVLLVEVRPPEAHVLRALWTHGGPGLDLVVLGRDPYGDGDHQIRFYRPPDARVTAVDDWDALRSALAGGGPDRLVLLPHNWLPEEATFLEDPCGVVWRLYPDVVEPLGLRPTLEKNKSAMLLHCPTP